MKRALWISAGLVVLAALALAVVLVVTGDQPYRVTVATTTTCTAPSTTTTTTTTTVTTTTTTLTTTTTPSSAPAPSGLRTGARGRAVLALEERLDALGYWLGAPDEVYDAATAHAVVAFQKLHGLARDGVAGPRVLDALAAASRPTPRSPTGRLVEIDLRRQVLLVVDGGRVAAVLDISTGRVAGTTPTGHFRVTRQIDGYHRSPLGVLYRPKYFYRGVAVHGYPSVPPTPASHGCVRTTNKAMDWLWSSGLMPVGTPVWVYR